MNPVGKMPLQNRATAEEGRESAALCRPVPGVVDAALMLETALTCRDLHQAMERGEFEVRGADGERAAIGMMRLDFFFRLVPSILDPRRIVALADRAAGNPDWWRANRLKFFCPEMTYRDIAASLRLLPHQVRDYCRHAELTDDCYNNLPKI